ncbi:MAG TPA: iron ABC transporter permease [Actinomycetota bacterium]|nr:iron ABC transporter permease [Actinomycetota bacterium]
MGIRATATEATARRHRRVPAGLAASAGVVVALVAVAPVYLLVRASEATSSSWDLILRGRTIALTVNTLGLAGAVTAAATALGVTAAWIAVRSDIPARRVWATAFALPLVFPSYVGAFALLAALGPRGLLQGWLEPLGVDRLPDIGGFPGAFLALTLFTYPYVYLVAASALRGVDPTWDEAARTLGRSRWYAFRTVTLPLLRPALAGGSLLVALYVLHDFGAVSLMRFQTFTQAIFLQYKAAFDRTPAAILSLLLVALAIVVVAFEQRARGRARYHRTGAGSGRAPGPVRLGRWRWPALVFSGVVVGVALVLPAGVLLYLLVQGLAEGVPFNLTVGAIGGSAFVSSLGAVGTVAAAVPLAILSARHSGSVGRAAEGAAYVGYALPGLVVALAFVFLTAGTVPWLYQSLPLVVLAYVVLFLPQAVEPLRSGLLQVNPRIEEAGRTLGRTRGQVVRRIVLPALARPALAGAALVCLTAMKELPATILLRPTGFETLATRVWTSASAGLYSRAAVPALLLIAVASLPLWALAGRLGAPEDGR